jgi:methionine-rich copper-binding protein CopC
MKPWLAGWLFIAMPLLANAHAYLVSSDPPHKSTLAAGPTRLKLKFSEPIEVAFVKLALQRDGAALKQTLKVSAGPDKRSVLVETSVPGAGRYQLDWSIVARDGHRTEGNVMFNVNAR